MSNEFQHEQEAFTVIANTNANANANENENANMVGTQPSHSQDPAFSLHQHPTQDEYNYNIQYATASYSPRGAYM
jgi:hypothetical protein